MQIIDSIKSVFDRKSNCCHIVNSEWVLTESDAGATFLKMTFHYANAEFGTITNDFYKGVGNVTCDRSTYLKDKDCDGVSFICDGDVRKLFLVDMKSSFNENNIFDAYKQDFFTFLKMHMMLSLCAGYNLQDWEVNYYVACPPCKSEAEAASIKDNIMMNEQIGQDRFIDRCIKEYFYGGSDYICNIFETPLCNGKQLHESIQNSTIHFHIFCPDNPDDTEGILNL